MTALLVPGCFRCYDMHCDDDDDDAHKLIFLLQANCSSMYGDSVGYGLGSTCII